MSGERPEAKADPRRPRAILFLSLILLIYNLAASARQDFFWPAPHSGIAGPGQPTASIPVATAGQFLRSAGKGPLTLRQKFLSGARIDVNRAPMRELSELPGISDRVASAMVAERSRIGRYRTPSDLLEVRGIKEKRLQKILPFLSGFDNN
jgi:competence ComEA-like helix-hairpin-helix protein